MFATQFEYDAAQARKRRFLAAHPAYGYPAARQPIDSWRPRELPGLLPPLERMMMPITPGVSSIAEIAETFDQTEAH
jgi:hypothetical protein